MVQNPMRRTTAKCATNCIVSGKMKGYPAYEDGKVAGRCNTHDKEAYDNVNFRLPSDDFDKAHRVKSVVGSCIFPNFRGKGAAASMLEKICKDAAAEGYDCIEAYPFDNDESNAYHRPRSLYVKCGFQKHKRLDGCTVFRKVL